ncbi:MAG: VPLPA-CTERM sorting domain-containing protein [Pseudomonadota bacterium]
MNKIISFATFAIVILSLSSADAASVTFSGSITPLEPALEPVFGTTIDLLGVVKFPENPVLIDTINDVSAQARYRYTFFEITINGQTFNFPGSSENLRALIIRDSNTSSSDNISIQAGGFVDDITFGDTLVEDVLITLQAAGLSSAFSSIEFSELALIETSALFNKVIDFQFRLDGVRYDLRASQDVIYTVDFDHAATVVPIPATAPLFMTGFAAVLALVRRKKSIMSED